MISQQQIDAFAQGFASLNRDNLERLAELYHPEVQFTDPLHQVHGLPALEAYCSNLYSNLNSCMTRYHNNWSKFIFFIN